MSMLSTLCIMGKLDCSKLKTSLISGDAKRQSKNFWPTIVLMSNYLNFETKLITLISYFFQRKANADHLLMI